MARIFVNGKEVFAGDASGADSVVVVGGSITVGGDVIASNVGNGSSVRVQWDGPLASFRVSGSAEVSGGVSGDVDAGGSVRCGDVGGSVDAGGSVQCGKVGGDVDAGGSIKMSR